APGSAIFYRSAQRTGRRDLRPVYGSRHNLFGSGAPRPYTDGLRHQSAESHSPGAASSTAGASSNRQTSRRNRVRHHGGTPGGIARILSSQNVTRDRRVEGLSAAPGSD